jgi:hypothetical protein
MYYHLFPARAATRLAQVHFWLAQMSLVTLVVALYLLFAGDASADPLAAVSSVGLLLSMILYGIIAWPVLQGRH